MNWKQYRWMIAFGAAGAVVVVLTAMVVRRVGRAQLTGATPAERKACISRLAARRPPGAGEAIAGAAGDADASVRLVALISLRQFVDEAHRPAVEAGTRDPAPQVRAAAAATLAGYDDASAADRLAEMARDDDDPKVRQAAMEALGDCQAPKALVLLVETMDKGDDRRLRSRAADVLAEKYSIRHEGLELSDPRQWRHFVELVKGAPGVAEAFRECSRPLERHPEDLIPGREDH